MSENEILLMRRRAVQGVAALFGGSIAAPGIGTIMSMVSAAAKAQAPVFFDFDQFALIERIVDVMIPETDTPGAHAAGVHHFIDLMFSEWAAPQRQQRWVEGLEALDAELRAAGGEQFVNLTPAAQHEALARVDAEALADSSDEPFYAELKNMVMFSYYSTEVGATAELQYEALPGLYESCGNVTDDTRAWFYMGFGHGL